eukprot:2854541-Alexandrium_andersonii.AAC.1
MSTPSRASALVLGGRAVRKRQATCALILGRPWPRLGATLGARGVALILDLARNSCPPLAAPRRSCWGFGAALGGGALC